MPMMGKPLGPGGFRFPLAVMIRLRRGFHSTAPVHALALSPKLVRCFLAS